MLHLDWRYANILLTITLNMYYIYFTMTLNYLHSFVICGRAFIKTFCYRRERSGEYAQVENFHMMEIPTNHKNSSPQRTSTYINQPHQQQILTNKCVASNHMGNVLAWRCLHRCYQRLYSPTCDRMLTDFARKSLLSDILRSNLGSFAFKSWICKLAQI